MKSELIKEEWRPVRGYEGLYDVSNFGRVRCLDHWRDTYTSGYIQKSRILKAGKNSNGYLQVSLYKDGKGKMLYIHRLVWEAFNSYISDGYEVNHINEIKTDNSLWNLNLMTPKQNANWGTAIKRRSKKHSQAVLQFTYPEGKFIKEWESATEAGRNGFHQSAVSRCCNGKLKQYKGFLWRKKC